MIFFFSTTSWLTAWKENFQAIRVLGEFILFWFDFSEMPMSFSAEGFLGSSTNYRIKGSAGSAMHPGAIQRQ